MGQNIIDFVPKMGQDASDFVLKMGQNIIDFVPKMGQDASDFVLKMGQATLILLQKWVKTEFI